MSAVPHAAQPAAPALRRGAAARGELAGAAAGAAVTLPLALTLGALAYSPLGPTGAATGIAAAFASVALGSLVIAAFRPGGLPSVGPSSATALIFAAFIARLTAEPGADAVGVLALAAAVLAASGLLLLALGALRLGAVARLVPRPVLAGFMNAVALLIAVGQIPALLGTTRAALDDVGFAAVGPSAPVAATLGGLTALLVWAIARRWPRVPAPLVGLLAGTLAFEAALAVWPGTAVLAQAGPIVPSWPLPTALLPLAGADASAMLSRHGGSAIATAALLALIGGLDSMLGLMAVEQALNVRSDPNRALMGLGAANVASGLIGGVPIGYLRLGAIATQRAGGRSWRASVAAGAALALAFALAAPWVARVPLAVLAGLMLVIAFALIDGWSRQLVERWLAGDRSADLQQSLLLVAIVAAVTLAFGFVAGVGAGVLLAMIVFTRTMNRSLLRARFDARQTPSRRIYPPPLEFALARSRKRIEIFELEGALFFGSAERLVEALQSLPRRTAFVILDFRRVSTLDASGAVALAQNIDRLEQRGVELLLAGVTSDNRHGRALRAFGIGVDRGRCYPDRDRAIEACEQMLLARAGHSAMVAAVELADNELLAGLDEAARERVIALLIEHRLAPGERLFAEGDAGDGMFLLTEGSVSVRGASQRFVTVSPGMMFGEAAMLDGGGRTGDAIADLASTVYELRAGDLMRLHDDDPALAARLYRNIARHLADRLRSAAGAWREAAR